MSAITEMKWFSLPGAKEAFLRDTKLALVHDPNQEIPWTSFYARSAKGWKTFAPAFPDQAWALHQIFLIDKNIDDTLNSLEGWVPDSCKPKPWTKVKTAKDEFEYYLDTAAMIHQRELILHYARVLKFYSYDESQTDQLRLQTFQSICQELVEMACLKDRARLIRQLLSPKTTAALLSTPSCEEASIWDVRREAMCRGWMVQRAMQKMREALDLEEEDYTGREDEEDDQDAGGNDEQSVAEEPQGQYNDPDRDEEVANGCCRCEACTADPEINSQKQASPDTEAGEAQSDLPLRTRSDCCAVIGRNADSGEGDWTSVLDENE